MNHDNMDLKKAISDYLLENGVDRSKPNCYTPIAKKFGVESEYIRQIYKRLRKKGLVDDNTVHKQFEDVTLGTKKLERSYQENIKAGSADVTTVTDKHIKTLQDLIDVCSIDTKVWNIDWWECNKWEVGAKDAASNLVIKPLFQVKAKLSKRKIAVDLELQKAKIIEELKAFAPNYGVLKNIQWSEKKNSNRKYLYEISLSDHHFGKLSWSPESGEDYDIKIAQKRWEKAVSELLSRVNLDTVERFLLPIGNDLFHMDNKNNSTTSGTVVDSDSRFFKMVSLVKGVLVETIDRLQSIAPVDVVIIPGNHDFHASLWIGEVLAAWYRKAEDVSIDYAPTTRKYYRYGQVGIQLTHGNEEPHGQLGLLFATQAKQLWADTKYHFCQIGHFHRVKKIQYVDIEEHPGFQVETLPSLSATDFWHFKKGYSSGKAAKAFLFHKDQGKVGEFYYNHEE